jgi:hypothetical protein
MPPLPQNVGGNAPQIIPWQAQRSDEMAGQAGVDERKRGEDWGNGQTDLSQFDGLFTRRLSSDAEKVRL